MRTARLLFLVLLLVGCDLALCSDTPLAPLATSPRWAVLIHAFPTAEPAFPLPGVETIVDPAGNDVAATLALYDENGALVSDRWIQSATTWPNASDSLDAATEVASRPGELTLVLTNGARAITSFSYATGEVSEELLAYGSPPPTGGQLGSIVRLEDGTITATRARYEDGGGDVVVLDPAGGLRNTIAIDSLFVEPVWPTEMVSLGGSAVMVGLHFEDSAVTGAVAIVDVVNGATARFDLLGYAGCTELASFGYDASADLTPVAVLCAGDLAMDIERRPGVGIVLLEVTGAAPRAVDERGAGSFGAGVVPTGPMVALAGDWVAVLARGDLTVARPDRLLAVHLSGDTTVQLIEEDARTDQVTALGEGDFARELGTAGELAWPSVEQGILRFQPTDASASATFTELAATPLPACARESARLVRHLAPPPTP